MRAWWPGRSILFPAQLFAAVPLLFLAVISFYHLHDAVPVAKRDRTGPLVSDRIILAAIDVDDAIENAERGQRGRWRQSAGGVRRPGVGASSLRRKSEPVRRSSRLEPSTA